MNDDFEKDLADGQKGEEAVKHFVENVLEIPFIKYNDNKSFDILFQKDYEEPVTFEVKTDYWEKDWDKGGSGNMAIEYKCRGVPSGVRTSLATYFAYYFPTIEDKHLWVIKMDKLKLLLKESNFSAKDAGEIDPKTGKKVSRCYMIPRFKYQTWFEIYTFDGRGDWLLS